ncbi:threonine/homoserine/homoserine lactone efflux protein [Actinoplanes octamycinicus]|uniref:Threonine/homoserine/homoserine lactone efflux protein n=1 Tax=Actinoplanes octamycinicus TaxID=135948 RepID=A0A7W7H3W7_9ACTN|nr:LysE family translocator [Actinoplanes octamycinicus]MBB4743354.1 threonine/homoserine/homoserine lactone efflux protein [Actinoplanes octamycinicus]GIE61870.1 lysine transporter LysE [Actinoplanes octamycinicus]
MPLDPHLLAAFTVTTIVATLAPGPDMLFVLGCGMRGGPRAGLLATAGIATSEAIHVLVAAAGLSALFTAVPGAFTALRQAGAVYLAFLGVQMIRRRGDLIMAGGGDGRRAYLNGVLTNLSNPKMIAFSVAFLPQFVDPALGAVWVQFVALGAILIVLEFLIDGGVGVFAGRLGGWLRHRRNLRRRIDTATGGLLIALGLRLAAQQ